MQNVQVAEVCFCHMYRSCSLVPDSREPGNEAIDHIRRSYICISLVDLSGCLSAYSVVVCHYVSFQWLISVSIKLNLLIY